MTPFSLATIVERGRESTAIVVGERLFPLFHLAPERPDLQGGLFELLQRWDDVGPALRALVDNLDERIGRAPNDPTLRLLAPVRYPRAIFCAVVNYYDVVEDVGAERPDKARTRPYMSTKLPNCVVGPDDAIILPTHTQKVDSEVELGVVIGRPCRQVLARDALDYVAGYTIVNDLSAREDNRPDWPRFGSDWLLWKGWDTSAPMGPCMVPRELVADPHELGLRVTRNGTRVQDGRTSSMIFSVEEQIEYLSSFLTLRPGDVIATGTPAGVAWPRATYLQPGDELVCEIDGIGTLRNTVVGPVSLVPPPLQGTAFA